MKVVAGSRPRYFHVSPLHLLCQKLRKPYVKLHIAHLTAPETTLLNWRAGFWIEIKHVRVVLPQRNIHGFSNVCATGINVSHLYGFGTRTPPARRDP
jgi:hypothetical protein